MITDLFNGFKCNCGNEDRYKFVRLKPLKVKGGIDWLCECKACETHFKVEWEREAGGEPC